MTRVPLRDESGAIIVMVALLMTVLLGMAALVIDVGGLLNLRRKMVNAADAGALAAAQSCAMGRGSEALAMSDAYASENVAGVGGATLFESDTCGSGEAGEVTVAYSKDQQLFFAQVLGNGNSADVGARATATWGGAGVGRPIPLMLNAGQMQSECDIPRVEPGARCSFWYSKSDLGSSTWGWINILTAGKVGWNVPASHHCVGTGGELAKYIPEGQEPLELNWPEPTYACADTGFRDVDWEVLRDEVGNIKTFPVNDGDGGYGASEGYEGHGQVDASGSFAAPPASPDKYDIVGFARFKLVALYDGDDQRATGSVAVSASSGECEELHDFTKDAPTYDISGLLGSCTTLNAADTVGDLMLSKDLKTFATPDDYDYDPMTHIVTWKTFKEDNDGQGIRIALPWSREGVVGTEGACGVRPDGKHQDKCLVVEWAGFSIHGGDPGGGGDFGMRALRLSE